MRRFAPIAAVVLVLSACGSGSTVKPIAILASSQGSIGPGTQRVMLATVDPDTGEFLASPDHRATVTLRNEDGTPIDTYDTEFIWTTADVRGIYVAYMDFPETGTYQATIEEEGLAAAGPVGIVVSQDPPMVQPGDEAPRSVTRTSFEYPDLAVISSDTDPDPEMYRLSVDQAVTDGTPAVIVFATPAWCVSQTCGPLLDLTKSLRPDFPGVDFVHVEVYDNIGVDSFEQLELVPAIGEWGLPSEPWVFVVDADGMVSASFEGAASRQELAAAVASVAG